MLRSLLPTALLAALAMALPVAADEGSLAPAAPVGCPTPGLACEALSAVGEDAAFLLRPAVDDSGSCSAFALHWDQPTNPLELDPDGCVWDLLRRTLDWPPTESQVHFTSDLPSSLGIGP